MIETILRFLGQDVGWTLWYLAQMPTSKPFKSRASRVSVTKDDLGRSVIVASPGWNEDEFEAAVPAELFVHNFDYELLPDGTEIWTVIFDADEDPA